MKNDSTIYIPLVDKIYGLYTINNNEITISVDNLLDYDHNENGMIYSPEYAIKHLALKGMKVNLDNNNQIIPDVMDMYNDSGHKVVNCKQSILQNDKMMWRFEDENNLQKHNDDFIKILDKNNNAPLHKRINELDVEIIKVQNFMDLLNTINIDSLNVKDEHYQFRRYKNERHKIPTSVFLENYYYLISDDIKQQVDDKIKEFYNIDLNDKNTKDVNKKILHKKICYYNFITIKNVINAYLNRLKLSREKIPQYKYLMSNKYMFSNVEKHRLVDKNSSLYYEYKFGGIDKFEEIYFIKTKNVFGLFKDGQTKNVYKPFGFTFAKSINTKQWNILITPSKVEKIEIISDAKINKYESIKINQIIDKSKKGKIKTKKKKTVIKS